MNSGHSPAQLLQDTQPHCQDPSFPLTMALPQTKETQGHAWLRPNPQPACFINYTESSPALSLLRPPLCIHPLTAGAGDTGAARYGCWGEQDSTGPTRSRQLAVEMPGGKADPANTARASDLSTEG